MLSREPAQILSWEPAQMLSRETAQILPREPVQILSREPAQIVPGAGRLRVQPLRGGGPSDTPWRAPKHRARPNCAAPRHFVARAGASGAASDISEVAYIRIAGESPALWDSRLHV